MQILASYSLVIVISMFVLFAVAEMLVPMNSVHQKLGFRWFANVMLMFLSLGFLRLLGPLLAFLSALLAEHLGFGLFNRVDLHPALVLLLGIVLMDFKQYWFHRLMHWFDAMWRIHRVHHSDMEIDLTTGFRFHPLEALLSMLVDLAVIAVFGITAEVLLVRYLLIFLVNFFTHANIRIAAAANRMLLWLLVTPSMHHLHHAMDRRAANSNFGVMFSCWDRLFGTYMGEHPAAGTGAGSTALVYGLPGYREPGKLNILRLTLMPFRTDAGPRENPPPAG